MIYVYRLEHRLIFIAVHIIHVNANMYNRISRTATRIPINKPSSELLATSFRSSCAEYIGSRRSLSLCGDCTVREGSDLARFPETRPPRHTTAVLILIIIISTIIRTLFITATTGMLKPYVYFDMCPVCLFVCLCACLRVPEITRPVPRLRLYRLCSKRSIESSCVALVHFVLLQSEEKLLGRPSCELATPTTPHAHLRYANSPPIVHMLCLTLVD